MDRLISTDKFINAAAAIGFLGLILHILTTSPGPFIVAAVAVMFILARATYCEHQERMASSLQMMAGNPRIRQGLPTDWSDPVGAAPSTEGVVADNVAYSQGKREERPESLQELDHAEEVSRRPPWIENPGQQPH